MKLRTKFTLGALCLIESVLITCLLLAAFLERRHLQARQREGLNLALERFAQVCRDSIQERNDIILLNYMKVAAASSGLVFMALTDTRNRVRLHSDLLQGNRSKVGAAWDIPEEPGETGIRVRERRSDGRALQEWSVPIFLEKRWVGTARMGYDAETLAGSLTNNLRESAWRLVALGALMSLIGVAGAFLLAWHVNRPIQDLSEATRRMAQGEMDHRVQPSTKDELGELVKSFNDMADELKRLHELRDETMSTVTHDLQSPLAAILNYAQLLREQAKGRLNAEDVECLDAICSGAKRLSGMTQDILDLAKLKAGKFFLRKAPIRIEEVVAEAKDMMAFTARELGVRVDTSMSPGLQVVNADPALLARVLVNLLANALRFTPEGGTVLVHALQLGQGVEIKVIDSGVGIPQERLGTLFTSFTQVPETMGASRKGVGTGLGLAICKEIVSAHRGEISATSIPGSGTTINVLLPTS